MSNWFLFDVETYVRGILLTSTPLLSSLERVNVNAFTETSCLFDKDVYNWYGILGVSFASR